MYMSYSVNNRKVEIDYDKFGEAQERIWGKKCENCGERSKELVCPKCNCERKMV